MLCYDSVAGLIAAAEAAGAPISQVVLADQAAQTDSTPQVLYRRMEEHLTVMAAAAQAGADPALRSTSGLTGGDSAKLHAVRHSSLSGPFLTGAMARAMAVAEYNAAMGKIVAAPTAGACGILPGALLTLLEERSLPRQQAVMALFTAGALGMVIANKASIAGAEGGCQAECGSAAAMAAAALVEMMGGTPDQVGHACAMAIKNQLGLVCDPVAGLVEIPCIKRNVAGVAVAVAAAEMALAGIRSKIPVDEVIQAMDRVSRALPCSLRETAQGGLAATPTAQQLRRQVFDL